MMCSQKGAETEGIGEEIAEESISSWEEGSNRSLEKIT